MGYPCGLHPMWHFWISGTVEADEGGLLVLAYVDEHGSAIPKAGRDPAGFGEKHVGQILKLHGRLEPVTDGSWSLGADDKEEIRQKANGSTTKAARLLVDVYLRDHQPPVIHRAVYSIIPTSKEWKVIAEVEQYDNRFRGRIKAGAIGEHTGRLVVAQEDTDRDRVRVVGRVTLWNTIDPLDPSVIEGKWEGVAGEWQ